MQFDEIAQIIRWGRITIRLAIALGVVFWFALGHEYAAGPFVAGAASALGTLATVNRKLNSLRAGSEGGAPDQQ